MAWSGVRSSFYHSWVSKLAMLLSQSSPFSMGVFHTIRAGWLSYTWANAITSEMRYWLILTTVTLPLWSIILSLEHLWWVFSSTILCSSSSNFKDFSMWPGRLELVLLLSWSCWRSWCDIATLDKNCSRLVFWVLLLIWGSWHGLILQLLKALIKFLLLALVLLI